MQPYLSGVLGALGSLLEQDDQPFVFREASRESEGKKAMHTTVRGQLVGNTALTLVKPFLLVFRRTDLAFQ